MELLGEILKMTGSDISPKLYHQESYGTITECGSNEVAHRCFRVK
jgi:hypothetical protein